MPRKTFGMNRDSWQDMHQLLVGTPQEFNPDSHKVRGRYTANDLYQSVGELPQRFWESARASEFTIYNYATPIAWRTNGQWICPDVRYSVTTSKLQGRIRPALAQISGGYLTEPPAAEAA